uniref:Phytocyanin domain-containing protein n=1 Tax=Glycine max TaxID=3847 RepID=C6T4R3_SOYBN|nr:unknown [Glycine max]
MALKLGHGVMILVIISASMFSVSMANKDWSFGFNYTDWWSRFGNHPQNKTQQQPKQIVVGGSEHWHYRFNYTDWAFKSAPFYLNDTLVFKYDAPNATSFPHSVYMFKSFGSFLKCDIEKAKMLANPMQGTGEGFKFVLKRWKPHYFACGERNGFHCNNGTMKFAVMPMIRPFWQWP